MSISIFTMPTSEDTLTAAIIPPQAAFSRKTNLAPDWIRVRIALLFSFRGLLDGTEPVAESLGSGGGQPTKFHIGLSNGGGHPGANGAKYIGVTGQQKYSNCLYKYSDIWRFNYAPNVTASRFTPCATNGGTVLLNTQSAMDIDCGATTPTAAAGHAFGVIIELYRYGDGKFTAYVGGLESVTLERQSRIGIMLARLLAMKPSASGSIDSGGWWTTETPTDCTTLYVHFPWAANRLVIHGMQVVRIA